MSTALEIRKRFADKLHRTRPDLDPHIFSSELLICLIEAVAEVIDARMGDPYRGPVPSVAKKSCPPR